MAIQYPYIPNSNTDIKQEMLDSLGIKSVEEIYSFIPQELRLDRPLALPAPMLAESDLKRHVDGILAANRTCGESISFLGAGCYDHYVPAICDEINGRSEFLTAYSGDTYVDHGKNQAFFEFTSLMGELLDMDCVSFPTYDGASSASTAIMMSRRINGRKQYIIPRNISHELDMQITSYCVNMEKVYVGYRADGQLDLEELKGKLCEDTACVFIQNPTFFGNLEEQGQQIADLAHAAGAQFAVYADPSSLGVIKPPAHYGADIVCGDIQPIGMHMSYGSGMGGYLATHVKAEYVLNYPHHLYGIFENDKGERGYFRSLPERTSYYRRAEGVEFLGTCVGLWAITAAVYLSVMGPKGMEELGENILYKSNYAKKKIAAIPGVKLLFQPSVSFKEFVINFDDSGKSVDEINTVLRERYDIFGGLDLSKKYGLGQSALYCVTEKTSQAQIDKLCTALKTILAE
ncbi:aminomethyl-transferring glycine dehydrogenase subunit GcvPA [Oscillibacter sp. MSJ-2]|uniref:Aminomethyl-transferring glycine dehydrogenase subunit GcvPA n=1 Tax=Dysosmobacter acutus TaxID=2841504 RepID=A0ABS6F792_9FIRM|nr:aminomethyl-transferring glycine dehydrogenase subunit GcvPA [Dysosmobacter acutus]MBU5626130.1 aminomethyl-transferring glycine dehydrogenase subunit GcvPA [Dysosmobacter acutus]